VPQVNGAWDVAWLGSDAGWLNGTAFPTWEGNSVLTAHVYQANGQPGPFVGLRSLTYGDRIIVHAYGQQYTFEVRSSRVASPGNTAYTFEHLEGYSYLTLVTCQGYEPSTGDYRWRRVVRAVLVEVR
jgi:LPXTG-site transpeptidase (sortase) family protein